MPQALTILFGSLFTIAASYALGQLLFARLRLRLYREEQPLLALICGASLLHLVVFAILAAQVAYKGVFLVAGLLIIACASWKGLFRKPAGPSLPPLSRFWNILFIGVFAVYAFLYWANAMAPEMSPDGSAYHLGLVSRYLRERGFSLLRTNMYGNLTQGIEMLYTMAFAFGRHSAASMVHFVFTLTLPWLMLQHARRFGFANAGAAGALLTLCAPITGVVGTTAYNDIATVTVLFALYSLLSIYMEESQDALLVPIGLLAGFCFACKYTVAIAIPFAAAHVLWKLWRSHKPWLRPAAIFVCCVALMVIPWLAKNWIIAGNPLSPFANRFFPNPTVTISFEQEYVDSMRHYGNPPSYWLIPGDLTLHGGMLSGFMGPIFVFTPLALLALRFPQGRRLLLAGFFFALPYLNNIGARFLIPALPFFSLALAMACARTPGVLPFFVVAHAILSWPHVMRIYTSPYAWRLQRVPVAAALHLTPEQKYLNERFGQYPIARMVEDFVPRGEKVFTFGGIPEAYTTRDILVAYQAALNNNLGQSIWTGLFPGEAPVRRLTFRYEAKSYRRLRLRQTKQSVGEQWSCNEWRVLYAGKEVPRSPEWRLQAWPNPWDVQLAFDNNPSTRWRTWEPLKPGMFLDLDFGGLRLSDSVVLEQTHDQANAELELYGLNDKDVWQRIGGSGEPSAVQMMSGLRRAAMDELRTRGIRYVLANPDDPAAVDYKQNTAAWGLTLLHEVNGTRLYRIDRNQE